MHVFPIDWILQSASPLFGSGLFWSFGILDLWFSPFLMSVVWYHKINQNGRENYMIRHTLTSPLGNVPLTHSKSSCVQNSTNNYLSYCATVLLRRP